MCLPLVLLDWARQGGRETNCKPRRWETLGQWNCENVGSWTVGMLDCAYDPNSDNMVMLDHGTVGCVGIWDYWTVGLLNSGMLGMWDC